MKTYQLPLAVTRSPGEIRTTITGRLICDFDKGTVRDAGPDDIQFEMTEGNLNDMLDLMEGAKAEFVEPDYSNIEARMLVQYAGMDHLLYGVFDALTFVGNKEEAGAVGTIRRAYNGLMYLCYAPGREMAI